MLEGLRRIIQEIKLSEDLSSALQAMTRQVCKTLGVEVCSVYLADYDKNQFVLRATKGLNPSGVGRLSMSFNEGIVGLVASREEPLNLEDISCHPNFHYLVGSDEEPFKSLLGAPIIHQRKVRGVLVLQRKSANKFDESEETFLTTLAAQLAGAVVGIEQRDALAIQGNEWLQTRQIDGVPTASGIAVGETKVFYPPADLSAVPDKPALSVSEERQRFRVALGQAQAEVANMKSRLENSLSREELGLFDAYLEILSSNSLGKDVEAEIDAGNWAPGALRVVVDKHVRVFESMEDPYLRERATDLMDLARRVLVHLEHDQMARPKLNKPAVVVAENITAAMLAELPLENIIGMVSMQGSPMSHAAILAKAIGIPAVSGFADIRVKQFEGQQVILDGYNGHLFIAPTQDLTQHYVRLMQEEGQLHRELQEQVSEPAITVDGRHIPLLVNTGLLADFEKSADLAAEGVGLYRTEIPFMTRSKFPSEEKQTRIYRTALESFNGKPVTFRTLDIGGDKQLPYFSINEDNPFLGWRGIRVTLDHPEIFLVQVRAILRASVDYPQIKIALPMIASIEEVDESLRLIRQAYREIISELNLSKDELPMPQTGIILEVPSAIYQLNGILKRVDFVSVGSNDLTQYLLAVDRNNSRVSSLFSNYHPALIAALKQVQEICHSANKPVFVCGEMAGDPLAAIVLCGLGYNGLSMNAKSLPKIKKVIRSYSYDEMRNMTHFALTLEKAKDIHAYLFECVEMKGLGGLIRAGK